MLQDLERSSVLVLVQEWALVLELHPLLVPSPPQLPLLLPRLLPQLLPPTLVEVLPLSSLRAMPQELERSMPHLLVREWEDLLLVAPPHLPLLPPQLLQPPPHLLQQPLLHLPLLYQILHLPLSSLRAMLLEVERSMPQLLVQEWEALVLVLQPQLPLLPPQLWPPQLPLPPQEEP